MENNTFLDLNALRETISQPDLETGAYQLDLAGFHYVYQFVRRIVERSGQDVQMVLFTVQAERDTDESRVIRAMDALEQAVHTSLRRSDISTRYSNRQIVVLLVDANAANADVIVERILGCYRRLHSDAGLWIAYDAARIETRYSGPGGFEERKQEKKTILVVDDDKTNLTLARNALSERYRVIAVSSGEQALRYLKNNGCDLVLLDINMPELDGFGTMKRIRQMERFGETPIIFLTADSDPETENRCLEEGAVDYIAKPFVIKVLRSRISRTLELEEYRHQLRQKVIEKTERITHIQDMTVLGMATMVERRDNSTGGHIKRTGDVVKVFTKYLYQVGYICDTDYVRKVIRAAPMHDLGKIAIDDRILRKNGKFTEEEYAEMQRHAAEGAKVIEQMLRGVDEDDFVDIAVNMARYHHEKWNGKGYPDGIAGEDIPLEARIMALADVFDALVSQRCYKPAFSYDGSFAVIEKALGVQFDPELGKLFLECRPELEKLYSGFETE